MEVADSLFQLTIDFSGTQSQLFRPLYLAHPYIAMLVCRLDPLESLFESWERFEKEQYLLLHLRVGIHAMFQGDDDPSASLFGSVFE